MQTIETKRDNLLARIQDLEHKTDHPIFEARDKDHYKREKNRLEWEYRYRYGSLPVDWLLHRRERVSDFNFVTNRVATGAAITTDTDVGDLIRAGITHVIDNRLEFDDTAVLASHPEISYLYNGVPDDGQPKPLDWFQKAIEFALSALSRPHTKVYSHCAAGVNRGPSIAYAILLAQGLDPNTAENLIRQRRPQVGLAYKLDAQRAVTQLGYNELGVGSAFGEIER